MTVHRPVVRLYTATLLAIGLCTSALAAEPAGSIANVFLTTTLDTLQPHVQSAVNLRVRVYSDQKLYGATVELAGNASALVQRIGKDVTTQETRDGRAYQVITRQYALVAQRSGEIQLDGPVLQAEVSDGHRPSASTIDRMFSQLNVDGGLIGTRALRLRGEPVNLVVKARPADQHSGDWLPAQQLTIEDVWQPADAVVAVGQPATRQLRLAAIGLGASQLPDLSTLMRLPAGLKAHPDAPMLADDVIDGHIVGRREQHFALLADHAGRFELPALTLAWWDVATNQRRETVLPAYTLEVKGGPGGAPGITGIEAAVLAASSPASAASARSTDTTMSMPAAFGVSLAAAGPGAQDVPASIRSGALPWAWISLGLGLLWLSTLGAWIGSRRRQGRADGTDMPPGSAQPPEPSPAAARRAFLQACRDNDARRARDTLIAWARATWPRTPPAGLNALARRVGDAQLTPLLRELDRACLDATSWKGEALARAWRALGHLGRQTASKQQLPGLYSEPDA